MNERKKILYAVLICVLLALIASAAGIYLLYTTAIERDGEELAAIAQTQARLIEAVARYDSRHTGRGTPPGEIPQATLDQVLDSFRQYQGIGNTGELLLGHRAGADMVYIAWQRKREPAHPKMVPHGASMPMRLALSGQSGTIIARDYRGVEVLAAYEALREFNLGVVAKIDLAEVRAPYQGAAAIATALAVLMVLLCAFLILRVSNPIIRRLQASESRVRAIVDSAADAIITINDKGMVESFNAAAERMFGYAPAEVIGRNVNMLMPEPYHSEHDSYLKNYLATGQPKVIGKGCRVTARRKDGSVFHVELIVSEMHADGAKKFVGMIRDTTERVKAQEALRESEANLAKAQEIARIGSWSFDVRTKKVTWSDELYRIFGLKPGEREPSFEMDMEFIHPEDRERMRRDVAESTSTGQAASFTYRIRRADGAERILLRHGQVFTNVAGEVVRVFGVTQDVTERIQAQEALRQSEDRLRRIYDSGAALIGISRAADGCFLDVNSEFLRVGGWERDEVIGHTSLELNIWSSAEGRQRVFDGVLQTGGVHSLEMIFRKKSGEQRQLLCSVQPIQIDGQACILGVAQDITERKRAEQLLHESELRYRHIVETAQEGVWQIDADSRTVFVNKKMADMLGYSVAEMIGQPLFAFMDEEAKAIAAHNVERRRQGIAEVHEFRFRRKDGSEMWALLSANPTFDEQGRYTGGFAMVADITERKRADGALRESEARLKEAQRIAQVGNWSLDLVTNELLWSDEIYRIFEIDPKEFGASYEAFLDAIHPEERELVNRAYTDSVKSKTPYTIVHRLRMKDGRVKYVQELCETFYDPDGRPLRSVGTVQDITERMQAEAEMQKLSRALEQTADAVMITSRSGIIEYVNPSFEATTGFGKEEVLGRKPSLIKSGKQGEDFYKKLWTTILAGEVFSEVFVNRKKDGTLYYEEKTITPLKDAQGHITHFVATGKDISERMQTQERLQFMAQHDVLTELPNRSLFLDRLKQSLARARWHQRLVAVLFLDLDRFKNINDTLGHQVGDRLLQMIGQRFNRSVREGDTVARLSGDEFAFLLDDVASDKDVSSIAQKILDSLKPVFVIDARELFVSASIGISLYPTDGEDSSTLLRNADVAMYRSKDLGKNTYQFYSADMSAKAFERLTLESSLRHALEREEFLLYYQPQMDVQTGELVGVEALLRWQHPDLGLVMPSDFIPLLEESGLIIQVGEWVLRAACAQVRAWQQAGREDMRLAVNLSARQFNAPGLAEMVERTTQELGFDPARLELEITESVIMRHAQATIDALDTFNRMGVQLAVDDFGTGYSSLSYLRRFPIDTLKIDRSFVRDIPHDPDDSAITAAIIVMAQSLKLRVIAEGVETQAQLDYLRAQGCHAMQGYLFSKPLPAAELTHLLNNPKTRA